MQRVGELGTLHPNWHVSIKSLPLGLREPRGRGERKGTEDTMLARLSSSYELAVMEALLFTGPVRQVL